MAVYGGLVSFAYLDQSHVSRMAKARLGVAPDADEENLLDLLGSAVSRGTLVCPFSYWHVAETISYATDAIRDEVVQIINRLSRGTCLRFFTDLIEDEIVNVLLAAPAPVPLGSGVDCLPRASLGPYTSKYFASLAPEHRFGAMVDLLHSDHQLLDSSEYCKNELLKVTTAAAELRDSRERRLLPTARNDWIAAFLASSETCTRPAVRLGRSRDEVRRDIANLSPEKIPTLASLAGIFARRAVSFGMKPKKGDALDNLHLTAIPHVRWFLTDRSAAEMARGIGKLFGAQVLADAAALAQVV